MYEDQSTELFVCGFFWGAECSFWLCGSCVELSYNTWTQFTPFKIQSNDKIFKIRFCFLKRRENPGYAHSLVNMAPLYLTSLFHVRISKYNLREVKKLIVLKVAITNFGLNTFKYLAISNWNSLPNETRRAPDLNTFVRMYKAV